MRRVSLSVTRLLDVVKKACLQSPFALNLDSKKHFSSFTKSLLGVSAAAPRASSSKRVRGKQTSLNHRQGNRSMGKNTVEALRTLKCQKNNVRVAINAKSGKKEAPLAQMALEDDDFPNREPLTGAKGQSLSARTSTSRGVTAQDAGKGAKSTSSRGGNNEMQSAFMKRSHYHEDNEAAPSIKSVDVQSEEYNMGLINTLEGIVIENPECLTYPLHTFQHIPDSFVRSFAAHRKLLVCRSLNEKNVMRKTVKEMELTMEAELPGKAFYFRVELEPIPSDPLNGTVSAADRLLRDEALSKLKQLLKDFTITSLEVSDVGVVCDLSHYAACAPLIAASKANVAQLARDTHCLLMGIPFDSEGIAGPTPAELLLPLSVEDITKEVAARITKEIIQPLSSNHQGDDVRTVRVFVGIATTPALATIAGDAEFAAWQREHRYHDESALQVDDLKMAASENASTRKTAVRIRSFHSHFKNIEEGKNFMANFRVANLPTFTPAFAQFLHDVYGIETCSDIYEKYNELHFSLSKETFKACYQAVFGRMRFPEEERVIMFSPSYIVSIRYMLKVLATNDISITDATRTKKRQTILTSIVSLENRGTNSYKLKVYRHKMADAKLAYGRLFTEEQFVNVTLRAVVRAHELIIKRGLTAGGLRVIVRNGNEPLESRSIDFPQTNDLDKMHRIAHRFALELAPYRQQKGIDRSNHPYYVQVILKGLDIGQMIPDPLEMEIQTLKKEFFRSIDLLRKFGFWRIGDKDVCRVRAIRERGRLYYAKIRAEEMRKANTPSNAATETQSVIV